jgi:ribosomal protein S15P/S13E
MEITKIQNILERCKSNKKDFKTKREINRLQGHLERNLQDIQIYFDAIA